jgi:hypothetical protein
MTSNYNVIMRQRQEAISRNRSIRMSNRIHGTGTALVDVPERPARPMGFEASETDGTYIGFYRTDNRAEVEEDLRAEGFDQFKLRPRAY